MGFFKTLSIVIAIFISINVKALDFYVGGGTTFSGVISESDYYNGATAIIPSANVGIRYDTISLEGFFRPGTLKNDHQGYKIDLETLQFGFMFRFTLEDIVDLNLGYHSTAVEGSSSVYNGTKLSGLLDQTFSSVVFGMGFNFPITEALRVRTDFNYYIGKEIYSLLQFDISVTYNVISF
ncbi:hypothetical protein BALOs_1077 [Halobacteriovorax sp. BALOs_7]|uniref:Outer membrane protein beta-barrel domain-containing protein n=1 Tax=Halobacteriovorax vibrionivorans TaxID=2152716 RepID=A0ABY0IEN2_9BACT|nr:MULTISPECIES: hypothetical protein [Halobacteriovorax]AYF44086.1 hypothetical protein BALOs_1077 [Halobacteriovorax sp. BALOs_7]RZF21389.1 hypothetical protein DAY19_06805 [Halobacteriovorax vibrionivorans]TGD46407.1 hypothetical protein EP118_12215 [Halobacteriovorax sp. Y22]